MQRLLARNMMQILGKSGKSPVNFVICWTPDGKDSGGTGYALRCAMHHGIKIYNLYSDQQTKELHELLASLK